jgi:hypothetical protein
MLPLPMQQARARLFALYGPDDASTQALFAHSPRPTTIQHRRIGEADLATNRFPAN